MMVRCYCTDCKYNENGYCGMNNATVSNDQMTVVCLYALTMRRMMITELTKEEAYVVAGFIDSFIFDAIRNDLEWDSFQNLRILVHAYDKCKANSGYDGMTDSGMEEDADGEVD